jgi:hypothetical protein
MEISIMKLRSLTLVALIATSCIFALPSYANYAKQSYYTGNNSFSDTTTQAIKSRACEDARIIATKIDEILKKNETLVQKLFNKREERIHDEISYDDIDKLPESIAIDFLHNRDKEWLKAHKLIANSKYVKCNYFPPQY